jgi:polysaccharide export outer membrane protein
MHRWMRRIGSLAAIAWLLVAGATVARAEDYVLGNEDVLAVSVWLHPELAASVTINADGNVTLAPVGEIHAAGLTTKQLGEKMADRLSAYLRQTTTVTVTVTQFMSRSVFVTGGVARPGRYAFERIPTLVDVLGQAGGALPAVDLSQVQVVRKEGSQRRSIPADLATALRTGDPSGLPELKPGDTIVVPGPSTPGSAVTGGVAVLGEVNRPGFSAASGELDVWSALAGCGGLTAKGNLADVRVLSRGEAGITVTRLDLRTVLDKGSRAPVPLHSGDVVVVMGKGASLWSGFLGVLTVSNTALNTAVLVDYLRTNRAAPR